jgi:opacity protein-like surface antigen
VGSKVKYEYGEVYKMKMIRMFLVLAMAMLVSASFAVAQGVGSPDAQCQSHGFDYGVAKFNWEGGDYVLSEEGVRDGYTVDVWGTASTVYWTSMPAAYAVLTKEGSDTYVHDGGFEGSINKTGQNDISHITLCGMDDHYEIPEFGLIGFAVIAMAGIGFLLYRRKF